MATWWQHQSVTALPWWQHQLVTGLPWHQHQSVSAEIEQPATSQWQLRGNNLTPVSSDWDGAACHQSVAAEIEQPCHKSVAAEMEQPCHQSVAAEMEQSCHKSVAAKMEQSCHQSVAAEIKQHATVVACETHIWPTMKTNGKLTSLIGWNSAAINHTSQKVEVH